jgi:hypothetical protein
VHCYPIAFYGEKRKSPENPFKKKHPITFHDLCIGKEKIGLRFYYLL